jgi:hypothetical protein
MNSQCCELLVIIVSIFYGFCDEFIVLGAFGNHDLYFLRFQNWMKSKNVQMLEIGILCPRHRR